MHVHPAIYQNSNAYVSTLRTAFCLSQHTFSLSLSLSLSLVCSFVHIGSWQLETVSMAGGQQDMRSWADLLHNSSQLLQSAAPSAPFPRIQRSLDQLESLSRQLKARTSRFDSSGQSIAATRLLAREGINADQLSRDLKAFELKTTFEDVFPVEATTVEEYLQQVHEMAILTAIQNAQKDNLRSFDDYIMRVREDDWQKQKRDFLNNLSRLPSASAYGMGKTSMTKVSSAQDLSLVPGPRRAPDTRTQDALTRGPQNIVEKKIAAYADVVSRLNSARERSRPFQVATVIKEAYSGIVGDPSSSKSVNMEKIWHLLQFLLGEATSPKGGLSRKMAMVVGARQHLEVGHEKYMLDIIQSHPAQASLGGSTGNLHRVRAFLRVRLRDHGILDFDATEMHRQPPSDTTWHQIYFCLRSGYYDEARAVAQTSRASRTFAPHLVEWITTGGMVSSATAAAVAEESERMGRLGDRAGRPGYDRKKMLLYALISGSRHQVERLLRDIPVLFNTIEDFMWFMLATVRVPGSDSSLASTQEAFPLYTLEDLQSYLVKFEPNYYTKNGKDPLVYPYVLALSLQLHAAISYLMKEINNEGYQIDAVHISIALADHGILSEGISGVHKPGIMDTVGEIASIVRHYGLSFIRQGNLAAALEYYVQAAAAIGGGAVSWSGHNTADQQRQRNMMLKQLLTEILMQDGGIALLLGPVGTGSEGALKRSLPDPQSQHNLLLHAARQCQDSGLYDKAVELLKRIEAYTLALDTVNHRLSDAISLMASGHVDVETKIAGLIQSGNDISEASRHSGASSSPEREQLAEQQLAFRQLESILSFHRFSRASRYHDAIRELSKLSFLPFSTQTTDRVMTTLQNVSPAVQACVPDLLKAAITCLNSTPDTDGNIRLLKHKIANFVANALPRNWPRELYEQVARML